MRPDHVIIAQKYDNNIEEPKYRWVVLEVDQRCEAPLLKTASASMGQVLDNRTLTDSLKVRRSQYSAGELAVRHGERDYFDRAEKDHSGSEADFLSDCGCPVADARGYAVERQWRPSRRSSWSASSGPQVPAA